MSDLKQYEEKNQLLNEYVNKLESDDLTLEERVKLYEDANALIKDLEDILDQARMRVEMVGKEEE